MKTNLSIFFWRLACALIASILIAIFWQNTVFITILLLVTAILINFKSNKLDIVFYITIAIFASLVESVAISTGAWSYTDQHVLNFPIWLPLYWGMGGVVMKDLYLVMKKYFI